jgi:carbon-monoxide dehydrogenase large subunit
MTAQPLGERVKRNEDPRLLTGRALFVDDLDLPDLAHAAFLRSPHAHARIRGIDVSRAREREGVFAVYTAEDLGAYWQHGPLLVPPPPVEGMVFHERTQVPLAKDKARHLGEPVVVVVAVSRYVAEDALADIAVDWEPLPAVVDLEKALAPGASLVHEDVGSNQAAYVPQKKGDYAAARAKADLVIRRRFSYDRGASAAIENRGVVAQWDRRAQRLTIWDTTQAPIPVRNGLAAMLGLSEHQVRLVAPFIGGGFGPKIMMFYPEEVLIPWLALQLDRPVKWIEDRSENFVGTTQERGQIHDAEIAFTRDGILLGVKDSFLHDSGAFDPYGLTVPLNSQCTLMGPYRVPAYESEFRAVFTNKTIVTPYRGAGRQHGVFVIIYQDFAPLYYDSGDYEPVLDKTLAMIGWDAFRREEQPRLRAAGRAVGIGVVSYVEGTGIGPFEGARVQVQPSGKVTVVTGIGTQGQGHFTVLAQIAAQQLGVEVEDVDVVTGDSDQFHWGTGTFASRGAVVAGNATNEAAKAVREKAIRLAAERLGVEEERIELAGGRARVAGEPGIDPKTSIGLGELARVANPMRGAAAMPASWRSTPRRCR